MCAKCMEETWLVLKRDEREREKKPGFIHNKVFENRHLTIYVRIRGSGLYATNRDFV